MGKFLYDFSIRAYKFLIHIVSPFNIKAKRFLKGRENILEKIENQIGESDVPKVWFHVASLGEFEQTRPLIEEFKNQFNNYHVILTFFSPSGYEVKKDYPHADFIFYQPYDSRGNAKRFLDLIKPSMVFFAKYEFWYYYLREIKSRSIPVISFSSIFRKEQLFFKTYGKFYRNILFMFDHLFVQNEESEKLLKKIKIDNVTVSGDTRFDRVFEIASRAEPIPLIRTFKGTRRVFIAGSAWMEDMKVLSSFIDNNEFNLKFIIAPHEVDDESIKKVEKLIDRKMKRFSLAEEDTIADFDILIIDNIGMLSRLYQYADFAFIGGAFGKGLHNILEAATFGIPIFFGDKKYDKFQEAIDLVQKGGAFPVSDHSDFANKIKPLVTHHEFYEKTGKINSEYVSSNRGATKMIINYVKNVLN